MKNKLAKILGIFLTTAMIAGMFVSAVPAMAKDQDWEKILTPGNNGQINEFVNWVGPIERAMNGDLYCAVGIEKDFDADDKSSLYKDNVYIYKSTDNGRTWKVTSGQPFASAAISLWTTNNAWHPIFDIACSPLFSNVLFATDGYDVWRSGNGGTSWQKQQNLFQENVLSVDPAGFIVSMDIGYYMGVEYLYAATSTFKQTVGAGAPTTSNGGAYYLRNDNNKWIDLEVGIQQATDANKMEGTKRYDVLEIKVLPSFSENMGIVIVYSDYNFAQSTTAPIYYGRTVVSTKFQVEKFTATWALAPLKYNTSGAISDQFVDATLLSASIWIPSDFSSTSTVFVGIAPMDGKVDQGDVFRVRFGSSSTVTDLNVNGPRTGIAVTDMDGTGTTSGATIIVAGYEPKAHTVSGNTHDDSDDVPQTWMTTTGGFGSTQPWIKNAKRPTGGRSLLWNVPAASVRITADNLAVVGTHSKGSDVYGWDPNGDCGLSILNTQFNQCGYGFGWNTIFFISTRIDQKVDMWVDSYGTIYMTTYADFSDDGELPQVFSAWRLDTAGGNRIWERVNSYSLYIQDYIKLATPKPVHFDFVRATSNSSEVILIDRDWQKLFYSTTRGDLWETYDIPLDLDQIIYSVLLLGDTKLMLGINGRQVYFTSNFWSWTWLNAFPNTAGISAVTDLRLASNQDVIAAGLGNGGVWVNRSVYSATNTGYSTWATAQCSGVEYVDWGFAAPADDYATSSVIYVTSDDDSVFYAPFTDTDKWLIADNEWYWTSGAKGDFWDDAVGEYRYLSNLVTAPGGIGFGAEGTGMVYETAYGSIPARDDGRDTCKNAVARIKGRVGEDDTRAAERIDFPYDKEWETKTADWTYPQKTVGLNGLWVGQASIGSVYLYSFGDDCNIWMYVDTLNRPVTGVKADVSLYLQECLEDCDLFQVDVQWNALANVSHYLVVLTTDKALDNYYDALEAAADGAVISNVVTKDITSVVITGLSPSKNYFVSVWGFKYTASGNLTGTTQVKAGKAIQESLSSFGGGVSFKTPPAAPGVKAPLAGAINVPVRPAFQWTAVPNATNYVLTVATNSSFANPILTVTTTAPAYIWGANDPVLDFDTSYFWRVTVNTPMGTSYGQIYTFTTVGPPPPSSPTPTFTLANPVITVPIPSITVPQPTVIVPSITIPQPTFTIPNITVVAPEVEAPGTPFYIWIIVAIGAILAIAVIVLIIRTRRVV